MMIQLNNIDVVLPNQRKLFAIKKFKIEAGEKILIKGASGQGKTTFLHLIAGLFLPTHGSVQIGEHHINQFSDDARAEFRKNNFGLIFQKLNLLDHLTALENVLLSIKDEARAIDALKKLNMGERINDKSNQMSLGEQQRVAVARVLAAQPKFILADEPTSSLDEENAMAVINSLVQIAQNKTLIVVSHDFRITKKFDRVIDFSEVISR